MSRGVEEIRKFGELSWNEQLMFSEAYFLQVTIGLLLKIVPFRWIPRLYTGKVESLKSKVESARNLEQGRRSQELETLNLIKTAIQRSSSCSPWKNKCLVSSLAARRMLNRRRIQSALSLGMAKNKDGKMIAHAWLKTGDFEVVEKVGDFTELYLF
jgi:hypothetical protein